MDTLYVHPLGMLLAHKNITLSGNNIGLYTINNEVSEVKRIIKMERYHLLERDPEANLPLAETRGESCYSCFYITDLPITLSMNDTEHSYYINLSQ
jgi:hypothetical protein